MRTSDRAKAVTLAGHTVTLKLKTAKFQSLTRQVRAESATNLAETIYALAEPLMDRLLEKGPFRLIGVGISDLVPAPEGEASARLFSDRQDALAKAEAASDRIRDRFGSDAIRRGRALR